MPGEIASYNVVALGWAGGQLAAFCIPVIKILAFFVERLYHFLTIGK